MEIESTFLVYTAMKARWESIINVFPEMKLRSLVISETYNYNVQSPYFHMHVSVSDLYIPRKDRPTYFAATR